MRLPIQVLIYVYREKRSGREYLICHRQPDSGGFWQAVSGGVESGEVPIESARRELEEETGLFDVEVVDIDYLFTFPLEAEFRSMYDKSISHKTAHVFIAHVPPETTIRLDPREHSESRWCSFEESLELIWWPEDKEALRRAEEFVRINW